MSNANPFPGYRAFSEIEGQQFFGRTAEVQELLDHVRRNTFVAVVGAPGVGKSSLIRAGLIPVLAEQQFRVACARPGEAPLQNLATELGIEPVRLETIESLLNQGERWLIVIDQFDEVFRYRDARQSLGTAREDADYVELLLRLANHSKGQVRVVIGLNHKSFAECSVYPRLSERLSQPGARYDLLPMAKQVLQETIQEQARAFDAQNFDAQNSDALNSDAQQRVSAELLEALTEHPFPVDLPMMQHALHQAWKQKDPDEELGMTHYQACGGTVERSGAEQVLFANANRVYDGLGDDEKELARKIFETITTRVEEGFERYPCPIQKIADYRAEDPGNVAAVVERFQDAQILMSPATGSTTSWTIVEPSYEPFRWMPPTEHSGQQNSVLTMDKDQKRTWIPAAGWASAVLAALILLPSMALLAIGLQNIVGPPKGELETECCSPTVCLNCTVETAQHVETASYVETARHIGSTRQVGTTSLVGSVWQLGTAWYVGSAEQVVTEGGGGVGRRGERGPRGEPGVNGRNGTNGQNGAPCVGCVTRPDVETIVNIAIKKALPSTGPALQFHGLSEVNKGFLYELKTDKAEIKELGLALALEGDCRSTRPSETEESWQILRVSEFTEPSSDVWQIGKQINTECLKVSTKKRTDRWTADDTDRAMSFQHDRLWYAITVSEESKGEPYAVVRRCSSECK